MDNDDEPWEYAGITLSGHVEALLLGVHNGVNYGTSHSLGTWPWRIAGHEWWDWTRGQIPGRHWAPHPDPEDLWRRYCIARLSGQIREIL